jgi:hypothetical protein
MENNMTNPFDAPSNKNNRHGASVSKLGTIDLGLAFSQGFEALTRNFLVLLGGFFVVFVLTVMSLLLCILPAIVVVPALSWGSQRAMLDAVDGELEFNTYFSGFDRLSEAVVNFILLGLALFALYIPVTILTWPIIYITQGEDIAVMLLGQLLSMSISFLYSAGLLSRFLFAPSLIVDRGATAMEALTQSWQATSGPNFLSVAVIQAASPLLTAIGLMACLVGAIPAAILASLVGAAAYRQVLGRP